MIYIAQDVPWYMIDKSEERPWRDEDMAMSAPRTLGKYDTRLEAALKLAAEYVRSLPRVLSAEEVEALERVRTQRHGEYLNHHLSVHHCLESRH